MGQHGIVLINSSKQTSSNITVLVLNRQKHTRDSSALKSKEFPKTVNHQPQTASIMKVKELQAKWLNGKFHCPPRDEWNGTFKTPSEINGAPISQIKNFITGQTDTGHQW